MAVSAEPLALSMLETLKRMELRQVYQGRAVACRHIPPPPG